MEGVKKFRRRVAGEESVFSEAVRCVQMGPGNHPPPRWINMGKRSRSTNRLRWNYLDQIKNKWIQMVSPQGADAAQGLQGVELK